MTEHDDLIARLRDLGGVPVDPGVASRHLTAMAAAGTGRRAARSRLGRAKVVAAFAAGLVLGGTSLASAGVMGEGVQNAVADAAAKVNVNLPGGKPRSTDGCGGITAKNHGDFVRQGGDPKANCGKPQKAVDNKAKAGGAGSDGAGAASSACKPPWAGPGKTKAERKAAREANPNWAPDPAQCPVDPDEADENEAENEAENEDEDEGNGPETTGSVGSQGAVVTPPEGGQDDNAGIPSDGSTPPTADEGDENRPDEVPAGPPSTLPGPATEHDTTASAAQP